MPNKMAKTTLLKCVVIAVLFHVAIAIALLFNNERPENQVESHKPEVVPPPKKVTPTATVPKQQIKTQIDERSEEPAYIYTWLDSDGVKHYSDKPPPPDLSNVEVRKKIKSENNSNRSSIIPQPHISAFASTSSSGKRTENVSVNYKRVSGEIIQRERTRLENLLEFHERRYWHREKTIISLEEKEGLRKPIIETKERLEKLAQSPEQYFGVNQSN